jgi:methylenetetrahydrofolate reductase (NADPH)
MADQLAFDRSLADPDQFTLTYELVPGQGAGGRKVERLLDFAQNAKKDGRITALSVTDNAGGHPALAPVAIGTEIKKIGLEPLVHFSLKDKNRNQVESHLFLYQREQFNYLLILGGDFPKTGYCGQAKPVFDLDTIQIIELIEHVKAGRYHCLHDSPHNPASFTFSCGCVVSPFKMTEAEQVWQYVKLLKKIKAGAQFIITQLGYDLDKYNELLRFLRQHHVTVPVLANVFVPSPKVAQIMAKGKVPGALIPSGLAGQMVSESKEERLNRAAGMIAILKGQGYGGVHLGGNGLCFADVSYILDRAEQLSPKWQEIYARINYSTPQIWNLYKNDNNHPVQRRLKPGKHLIGKKINELFHFLLFEQNNITAQLFGRVCLFCAARPTLNKLLTGAEWIIKAVLFSCRMCGDCTLSNSTYLCPQSGCPKKLVNGPCGGSSNGHCEVFPERFCFYVRVYNRLDPSCTLDHLGEQPVLQPKDWALEQSSSWINHFRTPFPRCPQTEKEK